MSDRKLDAWIAENITQAEKQENPNWGKFIPRFIYPEYTSDMNETVKFYTMTNQTDNYYVKILPGRTHKYMVEYVNFKTCKILHKSGDNPALLMCQAMYTMKTGKDWEDYDG